MNIYKGHRKEGKTEYDAVIMVYNSFSEFIMLDDLHLSPNSLFGFIIAVDIFSSLTIKEVNSYPSCYCSSNYVISYEAVPLIERYVNMHSLKNLFT